MSRVAVALPVYNEANVARRSCRVVLRFAARHRSYEFLFVDDGSTDGTDWLVEEALREAGEPNVRLIRHGKNRGKGQAIRTALGHAQADYFLFTDGDLAYGLHPLPSLVGALGRHDIVIGSRASGTRCDRVPVVRRVLGWSYNCATRTLLGLPFGDTQAGLKGFRMDTARDVFARQTVRGFSFDVELIVIAKRMGCRIAEVPAFVSPRHARKPSAIRWWRDPVQMAGELMQIYRNCACGRYD